jgi:predicted nucleic acid-binding protein
LSVQSSLFDAGALVVDASVAIRWFIPEVDWEAAAGVRRALVDFGLVMLVPELWYAEVANVVWKKRAAGLPNREAARILSSLTGAAVESHWHVALLPMAYELAVRCRVTVYDALYLALGLSAGAPFVTADKSLQAQLAAAGYGEAVVALADFPT